MSDTSNPAWDSVLHYVLQDDLHNRLTPRVVDVAYTAFMKAKGANDEDGGPTDWFTDTKPVITEMIDAITKDVLEQHEALTTERDALQAKLDKAVGALQGIRQAMFENHYNES